MGGCYAHGLQAKQFEASVRAETAEGLLLQATCRLGTAVLRGMAVQCMSGANTKQTQHYDTILLI